MSPKQNEEKFQAVVNAWETLRPAKTFGGLTLTQFKDAIKPSVDARASIATLDNQLLAEQNKRDDADRKSLETVMFVVNSVKGDPAEGENGELYEALGYVRKSERSSGLHRGAKPAAVKTT